MGSCICIVGLLSVQFKNILKACFMLQCKYQVVELISLSLFDSYVNEKSEFIFRKC